MLLKRRDTESTARSEAFFSAGRDTARHGVHIAFGRLPRPARAALRSQFSASDITRRHGAPLDRVARINGNKLLSSN